MPDRRKHRGRHPEDKRQFAPTQIQILRAALGDYSWLMTHGYARESALKLVGDRFALTARQRLAVLRSACSDTNLRTRRRKLVHLAQCRGQPLAIDGYNLLITIESALAGGMILIGRDGCFRDLASIHGTYRKVEETAAALTLVIEHVDSLGVSRVDWYLDRPVSNSGRLKVLLAEILEQRSGVADGHRDWNIELVNDPDALLSDCMEIVVTTDSAVLNRCARWANLAAEIIKTRCVQAWLVDLNDNAE